MDQSVVVVGLDMVVVVVLFVVVRDKHKKPVHSHPQMFEAEAVIVVGEEAPSAVQVPVINVPPVDVDRGKCDHIQAYLDEE